MSPNRVSQSRRENERREVIWFLAMISGTLIIVGYASVAVCMTIYLAATGEVMRAAVGLAATVVTVPTLCLLLCVQLDRLTDWQNAGRQ